MEFSREPSSADHPEGWGQTGHKAGVSPSQRPALPQPSPSHGTNTLSFLIKRGLVQRVSVSMVTGVWPPEASDWARLPHTFTRLTELAKGPTEMPPPSSLSHQLGASGPPTPNLSRSPWSPSCAPCGVYPGFRQSLAPPLAPRGLHLQVSKGPFFTVMQSFHVGEKS